MDISLKMAILIIAKNYNFSQDEILCSRLNWNFAAKTLSTPVIQPQ